jgi:hypothetical protein
LGGEEGAEVEVVGVAAGAAAAVVVCWWTQPVSGNAGVLLLLLPALVDPGSSKWKAAGDGCLACLCLGRYEHMNQKHGAWIEDGVESGWLERSARATTAAVGCWLLAACCLFAPASPSPSPTSFAKFAEDFLLHGFCNKLVIYLSSSVSNNSIRGLDFLVVDFLLLSCCSCCLFVCLFFGYCQFVA